MTLQETEGRTCRNLLLKALAVIGLPREYMLYTIFTIFLAIHQKPPCCFIVYQSIMEQLLIILSNYDVITVVHDLYFRAQNQATATYNNDYLLANDGIRWIRLIQ